MNECKLIEITSKIVITIGGKIKLLPIYGAKEVS
jgi:hypothetical protein